VFDTNLNTLVKQGTVPQCVRDFDLQVARGESWETLHSVRDNHHRFRRVDLPPTRADRLRVLVTATHGEPAARLYEVRVWNLRSDSASRVDTAAEPGRPDTICNPRA
jgi:hypothetical protein